MTGLEILFVTSILLVLVMWGWFVVQGFLTSRNWGYSLLFLFPISPFLFAYRFERKTRKGILYFIGSVALLAGVVLYAQLFTAGFFETFSDKLILAAEKITAPSKPKSAKPADLPKPTIIPEPLPLATVQPKPTTEVEQKATQKSSRKKTISVTEAQNYIGKNVVISTETVVHRGKLLSVGVAEIQVKKSMGGGTVVMGVEKSKITQFEVYP